MSVFASKFSFLATATFGNYRHSTKNSFPKKIHELRENYESYPIILQSVPIILKHTLVPLEYIDLAKTGSRSVRSVQIFLKMNAFHFFPFLDARVPVFNRRLTGKCDFS